MLSSGQREGRANWLDFFPLEQQISDGFGIKHNEFMIVDIGGGCGHESQAILTKYLTVPGRIILQDRREAIAQALQVEGMEAMSHDVSTSQLVIDTVS